MRRCGGGLHAGIEAVVSARDWEGEKSSPRYVQLQSTFSCRTDEYSIILKSLLTDLPVHYL